MAMTSEVKITVENFIADWNLNEQRLDYVQDMAQYLLRFIDHLRDRGMSERTINGHFRNCWAIGFLECDYGTQKTFFPGRMFDHPEAGYESEYKRKFNDSSYALGVYRRTWKKIHLYTKMLGYLQNK